MAKTIQYGILLKLRDEVSGGLAGIEKRMVSFRDKIGGASRVAQRGLLGMAAGLVAVAVKGGQQEQAEKGVQSALKATGQYSDATYESLKKLASQIQEDTNVGDEMSLGLQALALNLGVPAKEMETASKGAVGLAASLQIDLATAMQHVARAMGGQFQALQKSLPALQAVETEAEKMAIVEQKMAEGYEQAKDEADTLIGAAEGLSGAFGDLLETIGRVVLKTDDWKETLVAIKLKIQEIITGIENLSGKTTEHIQDLVKWVGAILLAVAALGPLASGVIAITKIFALLASPVALVVGLTGVIVGCLISVLDSLGLTKIGMGQLVTRWQMSVKSIDKFMVFISNSLLKFAGHVERTWSRMLSTMRAGMAEILKLREKMIGWVPGVEALEGVLGLDPEAYIKKLEDLNKKAKKDRAASERREEEATKETVLQHEERFPPGKGEPGPALAPAAAGAGGAAAGKARSGIAAVQAGMAKVNATAEDLLATAAAQGEATVGAMENMQENLKAQEDVTKDITRRLKNLNTSRH